MTNPKFGTAELLFGCARQMGLRPVWVTPLDTFAIRLNGQERYINLARSPLNSDASAALAKNKYVTRRILERHNMRNIPFTLPRTDAEAEEFLNQHGTIVAKPVTGSGARDIHIVTTQSQLHALNLVGYILEKYIAGQELRYLVLNDKVIGVYRSDYGTSVSQTRQLQCISYPEDSWSPTLIDWSLRTASTLNLKFAAVDYLIDKTGRAHILEVNTTPDLKWFHAPSSGPAVDVARLFLESVLDSVRSEQTFTSDLIISDSARAYS